MPWSGELMAKISAGPGERPASLGRRHFAAGFFGQPSRHPGFGI
jgi:hypothetical protein